MCVDLLNIMRDDNRIAFKFMWVYTTTIASVQLQLVVL